MNKPMNVQNIQQNIQNMRKMGLTLALGIGVFALFSSNAFAQGGGSGVGGGGTGVVLSDDQVVLADPFVSQTSQNVSKIKFELSKEVLEEARVAVQAMAVYAGFKSQTLIDEFSKAFVSGPGVEYYAVDRFPRYCPYQSPVVTKMPEGSRLEAVACTFENRTYVIKSVYERMSIREQTKLMIHEALRRFKSITSQENSDQLIANVTAGVDLVLRLNNNERMGLRNRLTQPEVACLQKMTEVVVSKKLINIDELLRDHLTFYNLNHNSLGADRQLAEGFYRVNLDQYRIFENGGGLIHRYASIDQNAYIGVGSLVSENSIFKKNSSLLQSAIGTCVVNCQLGENANIERFRLLDPKEFHVSHYVETDNYMKRVALGDAAYLSNVSTLNFEEIHLGAGTRVADSKIIQDRSSIGRTFSFNDTTKLIVDQKSMIQNLPLLFLENFSTATDYLKAATLLTVAPLLIAENIVWKISGVQFDGSKTPCQSRRYKIGKHRRKVTIQDENTIISSCAVPEISN